MTQGSPEHMDLQPERTMAPPLAWKPEAKTPVSAQLVSLSVDSAMTSWTSQTCPPTGDTDTTRIQLELDHHAAQT
ncbi:hypothetical protein CABS01_05269 [Colletotrichum abscissum]|uniref:Uncharacterized protein n=1 Tax=Colletotrichum abscissum TaxID=1671311 RepID=A0A9P9X4F6_9PEZI|nr:uncharacterized protein CABS01_05269 [Colletotrichum abscissum]KAI3535975.1 hypothetical protein CABS02_12720 [Colletotrichum abscissum]KAK1523648.1 hypothetical protein CABS01_05269 [Colletotrichum abscissum]